MGESVDVLQGVLAWDLVDVDLTAEVVADPTAIDTSVPVEYAISLMVTDSDGNTAEAVKYVFVDWPYEYYPVITSPNVIIPLGEPFDVIPGSMGLNAIKLSGLNPRTAHTSGFSWRFPKTGVQYPGNRNTQASQRACR